MKNPLTVPALVKWLKTKPAGKRYNYGSIHNCLLAQFLKETGAIGPHELIGGTFYGNRNLPIPVRLRIIAGQGKSTFGAALKRARKYL